MRNFVHALHDVNHTDNKSELCLNSDGDG